MRNRMLTDRRPILLANARVVDPSRDFDGLGDVLVADGVIRDARRGIGAAGVPEGTDIVNCAGMVIAPGWSTCAPLSASPAPATVRPLHPPARPQRPAV